MKRKLVLGMVAIMVFLCAGTSLSTAQAGAYFTMNVDILDMDSLRDTNYVNRNLSAPTQSLKVEKYISVSEELAMRVRLTLQQMDTGILVFDKNYGYQSGTFESEEIFLPYTGNPVTPYLVTLYVEDWVYAMPFMQTVPRMLHNGACTYGVRMRDYNPSLTSDWLMGTMISLQDLRRQGLLTIPLCASNAYIVGQATVAAVGEGQISVSLAFDTNANVEVAHYSIYCVTSVAQLTGIDGHQVGRSYAQGEVIDVGGAASVLLYIPMSISYDSVGMPTFDYDMAGNGELQRQLALWNENHAGATTEFEPQPYVEAETMPMAEPELTMPEDIPPLFDETVEIEFMPEIPEEFLIDPEGSTEELFVFSEEIAEEVFPSPVVPENGEESEVFWEQQP